MKRMNRKQRRAAKKAGRSQGLQDAGKQLQAALDTLQGAEALADIQKVAQTLSEVQSTVSETSLVLDALVEDVQTLSDELAKQREVTMMLVARFAPDLGVAGTNYASMTIHPGVRTVRGVEADLRIEYDERKRCQETESAT